MVTSVNSQLPILDSPLYLASTSPRRRALLSGIFPDLRCVSPDLTDDFEAGVQDNIHDPRRLVSVLSFLKAQSAAGCLSFRPGGTGCQPGTVIGVDTIVWLDDRILGKPADRAEAMAMLNFQSGRTQVVYSGVTLYRLETGRSLTFHETSRVTFKKLAKKVIADYIDRYKPFDKAGAYGIQETRDRFIESIDGSYYNVTGFPLEKFFRVSQEWL